MPFNKLNPAQDERLALLIEECGEVIQAAAKILRHGYESYNPTVPVEKRITNRVALEWEIGDLLYILELLKGGEDICEENCFARMVEKERAIQPYLHYQPRLSDD